MRCRWKCYMRLSISPFKRQGPRPSSLSPFQACRCTRWSSKNEPELWGQRLQLGFSEQWIQRSLISMALCNFLTCPGVPVSELLLCERHFKPLFCLCCYFEFLSLKAKWMLTAVADSYGLLRIETEAWNHSEALFLQIKARLRQNTGNLPSSSRWRSAASTPPSLLRRPHLYAWCAQPVLRESEKSGPH